MNLFYEELLKQFQETLGLKESPLGIYYTNDKPEGVAPQEGITGCMIGLLQNARKKGKTVYFDKAHFGCPGGAYYMGFFESPRPQRPSDDLPHAKRKEQLRNHGKAGKGEIHGALGELRPPDWVELALEAEEALGRIHQAAMLIEEPQKRVLRPGCPGSWLMLSPGTPPRESRGTPSEDSLAQAASIMSSLVPFGAASSVLVKSQ